MVSNIDDPLPTAGVQCAAVSVICELARKNPHNYLSLAPTFFKLMTSSTNNWMLIKIIKLVGVVKLDLSIEVYTVQTTFKRVWNTHINGRILFIKAPLKT